LAVTTAATKSIWTILSAAFFRGATGTVRDNGATPNGSALILKRVARRYDQVESGVFVPILGLGGAEESADLDRGSLLHEVLRDGGVLGAGLGEHDGVHEERLLAGAEVVGDGEAGDFPVLPFEVTGIGGEATREVETVDGFHDFDC